MEILKEEASLLLGKNLYQHDYYKIGLQRVKPNKKRETEQQFYLNSPSCYSPIL